MREYDPLDFAPLTFIVLPVLLAGALAWAVFLARRRSGAAVDTARRASAMTVAGAAAWMAATSAVINVVTVALLGIPALSIRWRDTC